MAEHCYWTPIATGSVEYTNRSGFESKSGIQDFLSASRVLHLPFRSRCSRYKRRAVRSPGLRITFARLVEHNQGWQYSRDCRSLQPTGEADPGSEIYLGDQKKLIFVSGELEDVPELAKDVSLPGELASSYQLDLSFYTGQLD
jgi:hypothetical protein